MPGAEPAGRVPGQPARRADEIEWLLQNVPGAREKVLAGDALVGTLDSWLIWKLTGGGAFVTDASNASTTSLWDPATGSWSPALAGLLGLPVELLATVSPSSAVYADADPGLFGGTRVPVAASAGDQQAAMLRQLCLEPGEGKATYGTSVMVDVNTGQQWVNGTGGYPLGLWRLGQGAEEEFVPARGNGHHRRRGRRLGKRDAAARIARGEPGAGSLGARRGGGVAFVPALQGLGSPYMDQSAKGALLGLTRATTRAHVARALSSRAWRSGPARSWKPCAPTRHRRGVRPPPGQRGHGGRRPIPPGPGRRAWHSR